MGRDAPHKADPLQVSHKAELDWDKTVDAMVQQYGRKFWLWHARKCFRDGMSSEQVMSEFLTRCGGMLKKGDPELIAGAIPRGSKQLVRKAAQLATRAGTLKAEGLEEGEVSAPG